MKTKLVPTLCLATFLSLTACQFNSGVSNNAGKPEDEKQAKDQTDKDLEYALAGESEANRKYLAFAEIADQEGYPQIARLWRAAATAEGIHAKNHMHALNMLKTTEQNLKGAVEGEAYEFKTMYPRFVKTAKEAGRTEAAQSMEWAFKVEQLHHEMFQEDLNDLEKGVKPPLVAYWVCEVCGNTVAKAPPEKCQICGSPKTVFFEVQ